MYGLRWARRSLGRINRQTRALGLFGRENDSQTVWNNAVSAAEKVVGYPTSVVSMRFWLSDEMSNVTVNMRKLIGSRHPLWKTAKGIMFDTNKTMQTRGLVVLLMSKAGGYPKIPQAFEHHILDDQYKPIQPGEKKEGDGILQKQRSLAEITEMIYTAFTLHKGVMDVDISAEVTPEMEDLLYGNKMALLSGDCLLAKASSGLSMLGNTYVVEVMASAIADLMESGCYLDDKLRTNPSYRLTIPDWEELVYKKGGCLYAKACQSTLILAEHPDYVTKSAHEFGRNFGMIKQIKADLESPDDNGDSRSNIQAIMDTQSIAELKRMYLDRSLQALNALPQSETKVALENIVKTLDSII